MLKNLDEDKDRFNEKAQEGVDAGYYDDINEGIRTNKKDEFGVQMMPGEQRQMKLQQYLIIYKRL